MTEARVYFVKGTDPTLRDREVSRLVKDLLGGEDRALALEDRTIPRRGGDDDDGGAAVEVDDVDEISGESLDLPLFAAIVNALQSPPFMTATRIVVVRDIQNLTADQGAWIAQYIASPLDTTRLVLVAGGVGRMANALAKALKSDEVAQVAPQSEATADVLGADAREKGVALTADAAQRVSAHLGEDAGRVPEFVEMLQSTYGDGATLDLAAVEAYLGELGTAGRFDLANAIDKGDMAGALEVLYRLLSATSGAGGAKPVHPFQVMASLVFHYQRMLRLDDPSITTSQQAADVLGMKSAGGARFPLEAARRLGTDGLREAMRLLAQAELDLRGAAGLDDRTVIEILVARLAALTKRHSPAPRGRPARR